MVKARCSDTAANQRLRVRWIKAFKAMGHGIPCCTVEALLLQDRP